MGDYTGLLYARPSFLEGMARVLDMAGTLNEYNTSPTGEEADIAALATDWHTVASDMRRAMHFLDRVQEQTGDGGQSKAKS